jgi:hypothetical protein
MRSKKSPLFKDMVRVASSLRYESGNFLKNDTGQPDSYIQGQFKKFSFLKEDTVREVITGYLNNIDRGT